MSSPFQKPFQSPFQKPVRGSFGRWDEDGLSPGAIAAWRKNADGSLTEYIGKSISELYPLVDPMLRSIVSADGGATKRTDAEIVALALASPYLNLGTILGKTGWGATAFPYNTPVSTLAKAHKFINKTVKPDFHVSNDGSDSNSGLSEVLPWETAAKVMSSTIPAGNNILSKRGDSFDESFSRQAVGLYFGAYGSGDNPVFLGDCLTNPWSAVVDPAPFTDNFETGNLNSWTAKTTGTVSAAAAPGTGHGSYAALFNNTGNGDSYLRKTLAAAKTSPTVKFSVYFDGTTSPGDNILVKYAAGNTMQLNWGYSSGSWRITPTFYNNDGTSSAAAGIVLGAAGAWYDIEIVVIAAASGQGSGVVKVGGVTAATITGLTNDTSGVVTGLQFNSWASGFRAYIDNVSVDSAPAGVYSKAINYTYGIKGCYEAGTLLTRDADADAASLSAKVLALASGHWFLYWVGSVMAVYAKPVVNTNVDLAVYRDYLFSLSAGSDSSSVSDISARNAGNGFVISGRNLLLDNLTADHMLQYGAFLVSCEDLTISNFESSYTRDDGIYSRFGKNITITNNEISHIQSDILGTYQVCEACAIGIQEDDGTVIEHNYIHDIENLSAVDWYRNSNCIVRYNTCIGATLGAPMGYSLEIYGNVSTDYQNKNLGPAVSHSHDFLTIERAGNVVTATFNVDHQMQVGDNITVATVDPVGFNGDFVIASADQVTRTITWSQTGSDESGTGGYAKDISTENMFIDIHHNTIVKVGAGGYGLYAVTDGGPNSLIKFHHNIVTLDPASPGTMVEIGHDNVMCDYNIYFVVDGNSVFTYKGTTFINDFEGYKAASGQDAHSIIADPGFVSSSDFHLTADSPAFAKDTGVQISAYTVDLDGNPVNGSPVGAYGYSGD